MTEKNCGSCCNWKSTGGPNTCGKCALTNITMTPHAGIHCPSHSLDVAGLRGETEKLRLFRESVQDMCASAKAYYGHSRMNLNVTPTLTLSAAIHIELLMRDVDEMPLSPLPTQEGEVTQ